MKQLVVILLFLIFHFGTVKNNTTNLFCKQDRCLTCINNKCITTCTGSEIDCRKCSLGTCCDGVRCNACRGRICCEDADCNSCIKTCMETCEINRTCHKTCFNQCLPDKYKTDNPKRFLFFPYNVTTYVKLNNMIKSNITVKHEVFVDGVLKNTSDCCNLVHPEKCQNVKDRTICFTPKSKECSTEVCNNSKNVHIVKVEGTEQPCFQVGVEPPHFYCGNYVLKDCDKCYICPDVENKRCADQSDCPQECKAGLKNDNKYNEFYNHV